MQLETFYFSLNYTLGIFMALTYVRNIYQQN